MADQKQPSTKMSLKLLIDTHGKRVLFAEAGKDFTDFLFHILSLPVGTVIGLLKNLENVGSLSNLYQSIENLSNSYMLPNKTKDALLKPPTAPQVPSLLQLPAGAAPPQTTVRDFYRCTYGTPRCIPYVSESPNATCPNCNRHMASTAFYVAYPSSTAAAAARPSSGGDGGYVKELVTYMIMDDLVVTPLSTISSITLLNKFNVKDVSLLEEKTVNFGMDEAVKLLNACMHSKMVLTEVFIKGTTTVKCEFNGSNATK